MTVKEINKIAATITVAVLGSFWIGSVLTFLMCFAASTGLRTIVNDFIIIYLVAFLIFGVIVFCISRFVLRNKEAYNYWVNN